MVQLRFSCRSLNSLQLNDVFFALVFYLGGVRTRDRQYMNSILITKQNIDILQNVYEINLDIFNNLFHKNLKNYIEKFQRLFIICYSLLKLTASKSFCGSFSRNLVVSYRKHKWLDKINLSYT